MRIVALFWLISMFIILSAGCDLTDGGLGYGYYPNLYYDYGVIPDASTIQSVSDYRSDAFDAANNAWDSYIRERRK